jgi:hypothetical protein
MILCRGFQSLREPWREGEGAAIGQFDGDPAGF